MQSGHPAGATLHVSEGPATSPTAAGTGAVDGQLRRRLLDALGPAVIVTDQAGIITGWNTDADRIYGWTADEAIGRHVIDIVISGELGTRAADIDMALRRGECRSDEAVVQRRDGTPFMALLHRTPVLDDHGALRATICITTDLTEWHRLDEEYSLAERKCRRGFEHAAGGVAIAGLDGTLLDANSALCAMHALSLDELLGKAPHELVLEGPDSARMAADMIARARNSVHAEVKIRRGDDQEAWALTNVSLIRDDQDQPDYFLIQLQDITDRKRAERALEQARSQALNALDGFVRAVAATIELRDPYTASHQARVAELATAIAVEMDLDNELVQGIKVAASIHDIGKIALPAEILSRPGKLTGTEFDLIKTHAQAGHDIVACVDFPWPVARMILEHHERLDGSGYPNGLGGDTILLGSRIIAVADVFEAVVTHRPYRPALGRDEAIRILSAERGTRLDPDAVDACLRVLIRNPDTLTAT
jgi:PAS domain S-box-containing protein/putative nucleotidyltransferase with HDIG domain